MRAVQIHVCASGSAWERRNLLFRDYLRSNEAARTRYLAAKLNLAKRWRDDRVAYADAMTAVINRLIEQGEIWALERVWRP